MTTTILEVETELDATTPSSSTSSTTTTDEEYQVNRCTIVTVIRRPNAVVEIQSVTDTFTPPRKSVPTPAQTLASTSTTYPGGIEFAQLEAVDDVAACSQERRTREQDNVHITEITRTIVPPASGASSPQPHGGCLFKQSPGEVGGRWGGAVLWFLFLFLGWG